MTENFLELDGGGRSTVQRRSVNCTLKMVRAVHFVMCFTMMTNYRKERKRREREGELTLLLKPRQ